MPALSDCTSVEARAGKRSGRVCSDEPSHLRAEPSTPGPPSTPTNPPTMTEPNRTYVTIAVLLGTGKKCKEAVLFDKNMGDDVTQNDDFQ